MDSLKAQFYHFISFHFHLERAEIICAEKINCVQRLVARSIRRKRPSILYYYRHKIIATKRFTGVKWRK